MQQRRLPFPPFPALEQAGRTPAVRGCFCLPVDTRRSFRLLETLHPPIRDELAQTLPRFVPPPVLGSWRGQPPAGGRRPRPPATRPSPPGPRTPRAAPPGRAAGAAAGRGQRGAAGEGGGGVGSSCLRPPPASARPHAAAAGARAGGSAAGPGRGRMVRWRGRARGVAVAVAHGLCSGSLNILLKFLLARYHFAFLTLLQCLSSAAAALGLEALRRRGLAALPPFGLRLARPFAAVAALATLQSTLTLWSLRGLSLPMYVVFKRCLPLVTLLTGALVLRDGMPSPGVLVAVLITTCGAALAGECPPRRDGTGRDGGDAEQSGTGMQRDERAAALRGAPTAAPPPLSEPLRPGTAG